MITWDAGKTWSRLSKPLYKNSNGDWVKDDRIGEGQSKTQKIANDYQNNLDYNLNLHLEKTETSTGYHVPSITTKESYPGQICCFKGSPKGRYHPQRILALRFMVL